MSLEFLPRKVQQQVNKSTSKKLGQDGVYSNEGLIRTTQVTKGKEKAPSDTITDETILISLRLAFSNYNLHNDNKLRELLSGVDVDECLLFCVLVVHPSLTEKPDISLDQILLQCNLLRTLKTIGRSRLVRLIKFHFPDIEIRLRLSEPSTSRFDDDGGFEMKSLKWTQTRQWDAGFWEERTVYIVCNSSHHPLIGLFIHIFEHLTGEHTE
jgi:hypothetical protein